MGRPPKNRPEPAEPGPDDPITVRERLLALETQSALGMNEVMGLKRGVNTNMAALESRVAALESGLEAITARVATPDPPKPAAVLEVPRPQPKRPGFWGRLRKCHDD